MFWKRRPICFRPPTGSHVATNIMGTNGVWQFTDMEGTNLPNRFYRLELEP